MQTLDDIQVEIGQWAHRNFGDTHGLDHIAPLLGVAEELGELVHEILKEKQGIREPSRDKEQDAVGDLLVYLLDFCHRRNYLASDCLQEAWQEVQRRDWVQFPKNGRTE